MIKPILIALFLSTGAAAQPVAHFVKVEKTETVSVEGTVEQIAKIAESLPESIARQIHAILTVVELSGDPEDVYELEFSYEYQTSRADAGITPMSDRGDKEERRCKTTVKVKRKKSTGGKAAGGAKRIVRGGGSVNHEKDTDIEIIVEGEGSPQDCADAAATIIERIHKEDP